MQLSAAGLLLKHISAVVRQKCETQHGVNKKTKHAKFSEIENDYFLLPDTHTCTYQGVRNVRFSENLACFDFLLPLFWDSLFCLITDDMAF